MIIVTGGAGFIGSNLVKRLNALGHRDIVVVDDLTDGKKFVNLVDCEIADYLDLDEFLTAIRAGHYQQCEAVFHQGACSATTEWNGKYMMQNNYTYSKVLLHHCLDHNIPFLYASSAATYGNNTVFVESPQHEAPLNVYGYSKLQFDNYVRRVLPTTNSLVVGFRYFNVYGPREQHKGSMASVAWHLHNQLLNEGTIRLFEGSGGYSDGDQRRDFIYIDDVVNVNVWAWQQHMTSGIYNVGTGQAESFNAVANAVLDWHGRGKLIYIPFPAHLVGCYQSFTQADLTALRQAGYQQSFKSVAVGVKAYLDWLDQK